MTVLSVAAVLLLLIWLQDFIYSAYWNRKILCDLRFSERNSTEGATLELIETLSNAKVLPLPWIALKFQVSRNLIFDGRNSNVSDDYYRNDMFAALSYRKITRRLAFNCARRGFYTIKNVDIVSGNIMMNRKLVTHIGTNATLTVYPKLIPIDEQLFAYKNLLGDVITRRFILPDPFEFRCIREYQPFDSFRSINFKATAKTGQMMVNVNEYTASQQVVVILNLEPYAQFYSHTLFEMSIRLAASLSEYAIEKGIQLRFVTNGKDIETGQSADIAGGAGSGHFTNILESLARVDLERKPAGITSALRDMAAFNKTDSVYILISPNNNGDLLAAFNMLKETGSDALWIIPAYEDSKMNISLSEDIIKWSPMLNEQTAVL
ncbi:MAG: DUF58 domain-containing protein [Clostridiales bacterium]|nr:DUF58 domain-containing protein [Clostridiales bacterium]